jgi:hypothetical protein
MARPERVQLPNAQRRKILFARKLDLFFDHYHGQSKAIDGAAPGNPTCHGSKS